MGSAVETSVALVAYLALFASVGMIFLFVNLLVGKFLRPSNPTPEKLEIYARVGRGRRHVPEILADRATAPIELRLGDDRVVDLGDRVVRHVAGAPGAAEDQQAANRGGGESPGASGAK